MSRITKDLASSISCKMTEASRKHANDLNNEYRALVKSLYEAQTPEELKTMFQKYPSWIQVTGYVVLNGFGWNYEKIGIEGNVIPNTESSVAMLELNKSNSSMISAAERKWKKASDEYKKLRNDLRTALTALSTYSRIREHLPSAAPFLPVEISRSLVANYKPLERKIQSQIIPSESSNKN